MKKFIFILLIYFLSLLYIISQREILVYYDEAIRCMDGIFYKSLFNDISTVSFSNIIPYIERFYSYYPGLYIIFYPPLNQLITGIFYFLFGINNITSRLSILIFSILSVYFFYKLISEFYSKELKKIMILIMILSPHFIFLSTTNFLEIPIVFFTIICTYYFLRTFIKNEDHSTKLGILLGLAFLTKWTIVILYFTFLIFLFIKKRNEIFKKRFLKTSLIFLLLSTPFLAVMVFTGGLNALFLATTGQSLSITDLYFYLFSPFDIFSPLLAIFGLLGIYYLFKKKKEPQYFFVLLYFLLFVIIFTSIFRTWRHRRATMFYLPFFPILISLTLKKIENRSKNKHIFYLLVFLLLFSEIIYGFNVIIDDARVYDLNIGLDKASSFLVESNLPENSNILVLDDSPIFIYYLYKKLPLFSHHIVRLKHCDNVSNFNSYIQENNIYYIIGISKYIRRFPELQSLNKTIIKSVEIYKTNLTEFPRKKICNGFCKVDYTFCSY